MRKILLVPFLPILALQLLVLGGCQSNATPEAVVYDTLQQASNAIQAKHALFEVQVAANKVSVEKEIEVRTAYVRANRSIAAAARALQGGFNAATPADVDRLVAAFLSIVVQVIPPENR